MNPFFNVMQAMNPMSNMLSMIQRVRQNPNQLGPLLQQRGIITPQQAKDIEQMGSNYAQIGQYLMQNGRMPGNVQQQYQSQVDQIQNIIKQ